MTNLQKVERLKEVKSGLETLLSHARDLYDEVLTKIDVGFGVTVSRAETAIDELVADLNDLILQVDHDLIVLEGK